MSYLEFVTTKIYTFRKRKIRWASRQKKKVIYRLTECASVCVGEGFHEALVDLRIIQGNI